MLLPADALIGAIANMAAAAAAKATPEILFAVIIESTFKFKKLVVVLVFFIFTNYVGLESRVFK